MSFQTSLVLAVVDELADLMPVDPRDVEAAIARVTQRAQLPREQPIAESLVWRSETGHLLLDGKAMTHQQATHLCLTHSRNEIDPSRTTPTRIVYRTPGGAVRAYQGTRPAHPITSQPQPKRSRS